MAKHAVLAFSIVSAVAVAASADDATTSASSVVVTSPSVVVVTAPGAPASVASPLPPPQNEPWRDVSHINGVPVPVGERNRYLYRYKKANLQTNPIGWMFGYYQLAASYAASANAALSVELSYYAPIESGGGNSATQISGTVPIYFKHVFDGPFLEPGLLVRNEGSGTFTGVQVMIGWAWMFDCGLNMSAAIGAARRIGNGNGDDDDDLAPAGYFRVGYAF